ncbi:MAG: phosphotransferase [Actinomycetia bacterium]|nr:phosphotransferase [Actinomycetes bacterium]
MLTAEEFEFIKNIKLFSPDGLGGIRAEPVGYAGPLQGLDDKELGTLCNELQGRGLIDGLRLTRFGELELANHRAKNAVILAAGGSETDPKLVYLQPKGLFKMNGVPLIERLISQLKEAGIDQIYVVVGYKKEMFFYLEESFGISLLINEMPRSGSVFSMLAALPVLDRTYILNCDNYYEENPFEPYVYTSYAATTDKDDTAHELGVTKNLSGRITALGTGSGPREVLYGHYYFNRGFSDTLKRLLVQKINDFRVDTLFWQEFYAQNIEDLDLCARKYRPGLIYEFDTIQELQAIDDIFIENVSASLIDIICEQLGCEKADIQNIVISKKGLSNILFTFDVFGKPYILRYPGASSSAINDRRREMVIQHRVAEIGVDNTHIYIDEDGCKIAYFLSDAHDLSEIYYHDLDFMEELVRKVKKLHACPLSPEDIAVMDFDVLESADGMMRSACSVKGDLFERFSGMRAEIQRLAAHMEADRIPKVLCHNDLNISNVLYSSTAFELIDWEFAGLNDPAFDFGRILDAYRPDSDEVRRLITIYLEHAPAPRELAHFFGGAAVHSWYYFCWCLYKESLNENTAFYMVYFYHRVKIWMSAALAIYDAVAK